MQELFQVAIDDENRAKEAVRKVTKAPTDAIVEVAGELSAAEITRLGLKAGEVFQAAEPIRFDEITNREGDRGKSARVDRLIPERREAE